MKIQIKNRFSGAVILDAEATSLRAAVVKGVSEDANLRCADLCGANLCGADLRDADLRDADLCGANLCFANLRDADLRDADLRYADLRDANLCFANLRGANLCGADLRDADLRGAKGIPEAPIVPHIDAAILAQLGKGGKLKMNSWHTCETTHCRAGWAIILAGKAGSELEKKTSSDTAGTLIYLASRPGKDAPDFYASDQDALGDLERCAALDPLPA